MPRFVVSGSKVNLGNNEYLATGGEGSVYAKGGKAYKIYHDPSKMIPTGKIQELSAINDHRVIRPTDVVYDGNKPVGYAMRHIVDSYPLCKTFTKAFRTRESLELPTIVDLIRGMRETVANIHSSNVLVVDLNEMNFLVDTGFKEVYFIDADSYQTKSYPATAIMESIRDRQSPKNQFSELTDWFSFAVVTFQMLVGIHPFKGKHPSLKGFEERMGANVSVFSNDVSMPKAAYPLDVIPKALKEWYYNVFENAVRVEPPTNFEASVAITMKVSIVAGTDNFEIKEVASFEDDVKYHISVGGVQATVAGNDVYFNGSKLFSSQSTPAVGIYGGAPYIFVNDKGRITAKNVLTNTEKSSDLGIEKMMIYDGRVYGKVGTNIIEVTLLNGLPISHMVGTTMMNATKMYPGVVIQNMLGLHVASVFPETKIAYQHKLNDLKGYNIIDAKYDNGVLVVVAIANGQYDKFLYMVNGNVCKLARKEKDITYTGLNFVVLDNGVYVSINENDDVVAFNIKHPDKVKVVSDDGVSSDFRLFKNGGKVLFSNGNQLFSLKMK